MKNKKTLLLLVIIFILVSASMYLVYVISDGSNPLTTLNLRAADEDPSLDQELDDLLAQVDGTPTPTIPYNSTSPTPSTATPSGTLTPIITATITGTIPTPTSYVEYITSTPVPTYEPMPTAVTTLPVAGLSDEIPKYLIGGGLLVILAMFL